MKKAISFIKKNLIAIWICVTALGLTSFWVYAEFMESFNHTQKVIANTADNNQRFSSDYLVTGSSAARTIGIPVENGASSYVVPVKIWNYDSTSAARFYPKALNYTLTAQLVNAEGQPIDSVAYNSKKPISAENTNKIIGQIGIGTESGGSITYNYFGSVSDDPVNHYMIPFTEPNFTGTTVEGVTTFQKDEHIYYLTFPAEMLTDNENVYVKLVATPGSDNSDLSPISAILSVTGSTIVLEDGWFGNFNDDEKISASRYDGFNYVISGNGSGEVTFSWNTDFLEVNSFFLVDNSITPTSFTKDGHLWKEFTIHVHSDDEEESGVLVPGKNRYDIQLYMTGDSSSDYADWETNINAYVDFKFEQSSN